MKLQSVLWLAAVVLLQTFVERIDAACPTHNVDSVCSNEQLPPGLVEVRQVYHEDTGRYESNCCPEGKKFNDNSCISPQYPYEYCSKTDLEMYREIAKSGTQKYNVMCCPHGDVDLPWQKINTTSCRLTRCMSDADVGNEADLCEKGLETRMYINNTLVQYREATRDQCNNAGGQNNSPGTVAVCCIPNTQSEYLTTLMGSEPREFPYFVRVGTNGCGGQIYNENWILTASHCVVNLDQGGSRKVWSLQADGQDKWEKHVAQVRLNLQIRGATTVNTYNVTEVHVHPGSSYIKPVTDKEADVNGVSINDLALLKLDRSIQFGENVKAIKIAATGFDPLKFGDHGLLTGHGDTDTTQQPLHRFKANMLIRQKDQINFNLQYHKMLLFGGGILDGKRSPLFGKGDSGGPFLCRDENGKAVLCGVVSFLTGNGTANCLQKLTKETCGVATYMDVGYYNEWIRNTTGEGQDNAQLVDQPLYGSEVGMNEFPAHVHVRAPDGVICGGTLIDDDVVMTAAHCVAKNNGQVKDGVEVDFGVTELKTGGGRTIKALDIKVMDNFRKVRRPLWGGGGRQKRVVSVVLESWQRGLLTDKDIMKDPYYKNDVALIKLYEKSDVTPAKLATTSPATGDMALEVAYPSKSLGTEANGKLPLTKRQFKILDRATCQKRMDWLSGLGYNGQIDENVVCGVEHFSGGSMCDRELGGGVYCMGDDGQYSEVCGVQVARLCEFNIPNEFVDVRRISKWIGNQLKTFKLYMIF